MFTFLLSLLGVGGFAAIGLGLALRFGLLSWLPGAVVNAIGAVVEFFFRALSWCADTFFTGQHNIWASWQGGFALVASCVLCMYVGTAPIDYALARGWAAVWPSAVEEQVPERVYGPPALQNATSKIKWPKLPSFKKSEPKAAADETNILRHPLGSN